LRNQLNRGCEYQLALKECSDLLQLLIQHTRREHPKSLGPTVRKLRDISAGLQSQIEYLLGGTFHNERYNDPSGQLPQRLFDVPELAEEIFSYLGIVDLLNAQQASRQFKAIIDASKSLQRFMLQQPDFDGHLLTPLDDISSDKSFRCYSTWYSPLEPGQGNEREARYSRFL